MQGSYNRGPCFGHITGLTKLQVTLLNLRQFHCSPAMVGECFKSRPSGLGLMGRRDAASQQSRGRSGLPALAVATALCLSGCASISQKFAETASQLPEVGLSPNAPA